MLEHRLRNRLILQIFWLPNTVVSIELQTGYDRCLPARSSRRRECPLTCFRSKADRNLKSPQEPNSPFFPQPVVERLEGPHRLHYKFKTSGYLNKSEFLRVHSQTCGNALHRCTLKHLLPRGSPCVRYCFRGARQVRTNLVLAEDRRRYRGSVGAQAIRSLPTSTRGRTSIRLGENECR